MTEMRTYLQAFMTECNYETEDIAFLCDAYDKVIAVPHAKDLLDLCLAMYRADRFCDYGDILGYSKQMATETGVHPYTTDLLVFLCLTQQAEIYFAQQQISREIFLHSMLDLRYKLEECKAVKGVIGSFVADWFPEFFRVKRFALGRLQFEVINFPQDYQKNGHTLKKGDKVLNVHIPRTGTPIAPATLDESFAMAKDFYREKMGEHPAVVCHSWLLWSENEKILSPKSNMVGFLKRFDLFEEGYCKNDSELWRLFDTDERHPDRLPGDSSARRAYIALLKAGNQTGWGYGVLFL